MKKMSRWGVGPIFAVLSIMYLFAPSMISKYYYPFFRMEFIQDKILLAAGIVLIVIGVPFYLVSSIGVMKAYNADRLITGSVFKCCRHPLYASWVVFIAPGIVLLLNSWLDLTIPIFMYIVLRVLVQKEEIYLENRFGAEYLKYKKDVPCILPYGLFLRSQGT